MELSTKDYKFINLAISVSDNSEMNFKHGCVLTKNGKIIGMGWNSYRNRFNDALNTPTFTCHAEMYALRRAFKAKRVQRCEKGDYVRRAIERRSTGRFRSLY